MKKSTKVGLDTAKGSYVGSVKGQTAGGEAGLVAGGLAGAAVSAITHRGGAGEKVASRIGKLSKKEHLGYSAAVGGLGTGAVVGTGAGAVYGHKGAKKAASESAMKHGYGADAAAHISKSAGKGHLIGGYLGAGIGAAHTAKSYHPAAVQGMHPNVGNKVGR